MLSTFLVNNEFICEESLLVKSNTIESTYDYIQGFHVIKSKNEPDRSS